MKATTKIILCGILSVLVFSGLFFAVKSSAQANRESANGQGTLILQDAQGKDIRRQFSFNARRDADGTVKGQAIVHNAEFTDANGKKFQGKFDITCFKVTGNSAVFGGTVRRVNDPSLATAVVFFAVRDNGEPGKDRDQISKVIFSPQPENTPADCETVTADTFPIPLITIDSGNVQVRGGSNQ